MDMGQAQDVMDSLALMADPALQQYAQMHKDDPYVMSLAMSESNRRKKLRAAQQGQAGQMPQPKVVDQEDRDTLTVVMSSTSTCVMLLDAW
jgi:hypothetical protein